MNNILGRGWSFPPRLNNGDRINMVQNDTDIRQAIFIILGTAPGERVMHPDFGCNIHDLIFWPANYQTAAIVERHVIEALGRWEPRITVVSVMATPGDVNDGHALMIDIAYEIKENHDVRSLVYPFYLIPS